MAVHKPLLKALGRSIEGAVPLWMMRQAGRYLPEYKSVREKAGDFLSLCYNPELAAEVTLQPIRRFGFDAAILFSDILVVPHALGQKVWFEEGEGPKLEPISNGDDLVGFRVDNIEPALAPVFETVSRVQNELDEKTALIGFCGAPWTVATYMVAGEGTKDQAPARLWAYKDPKGFQELVDLLVASSIVYLKGQIKAGAEVIQIFDTWAGALPISEQQRWCVEPVTQIATAIKKDHPEIPVIAFLKGAQAGYDQLVNADCVDAVGIDTAADMEFVRDHIQPKKCVQGNLDPIALLAGGGRLDEAIENIFKMVGGGPMIFNLGHGILPSTPIAHVEHLVKTVREKSKAIRGL